MSAPLETRTGPAVPSATGHAHLPALDGLRGLALCGVLAFHAAGSLRGGYLGVDLFFVLSGYLITALLVAEHARTGRIDLRAFWMRRARRLLPAVFAMMPAIAAYARWLAAPSELAGVRADALATLGYFANWRAIFFSKKNYWDLFAAPSPLEHMWSLAIEEQFYLLWPLVAYLALKFGGKRALGTAIGVLASVSIACMIYLYQPGHVSRVYLGTDARAAGLLVGAALGVGIGFAPKVPGTWVRLLDALAGLGALLLAVAWTQLPGDAYFLYHGGFWLTQLAALPLIVCAAHGSHTLTARVLAWAPLRALGKLSYGMYLWHWPINCVLTASRLHIQGAALHALQFCGALLVALISYYALEQPLRLHGLPRAWPARLKPLVVLLAAAGAWFAVVLGTRPRAQPALARASQIQRAQITSTPQQRDAARLRVAVFGDSTGNSLAWGLYGARPNDVAVDILGQDGCSMLTETCEAFTWPAKAKAARADVALLYVAGAYLYGFTRDGDWRYACYPAWNKQFQVNIRKSLEALAGSVKKVWAVTVPRPLGPYDSIKYQRQATCISVAMRGAAAGLAGVEVLELGAHLCPNETCETLVDGMPIRPDGVHFSMAGGMRMAEWIWPQIAPTAPMPDAGAPP